MIQGIIIIDVLADRQEEEPYVGDNDPELGKKIVCRRRGDITHVTQGLSPGL